jgi:DNA-directed RNA polymerase beta' subunit
MKRKLTSAEIEYITDFIHVNKAIPVNTALSIANSVKARLVAQLSKQTIYPEKIDELKQTIQQMYVSSLISPCESVGVICGQSIGERNTQLQLDSFHHAGQSEKQILTAVPRFQELLNASKEQKYNRATIHTNTEFGTIREFRKAVASKLIGTCLRDISTDFEISVVKTKEAWYDLFGAQFGNMSWYKPVPDLKHCISLVVDMDKLFELNITLVDIAKIINSEYDNLACIASPMNFGRLDVFIFDIDLIESAVGSDDIGENEVPEAFDVAEYLETTTFPMIEDIQICGIAGISDIFFSQKDGEWILETEGNSFKEVMSLDFVDTERTFSSHIWDMYNMFGVEAVHSILLTEFMELMGDTDRCHSLLLVDRMTFSGSIDSISRYTMRKDTSGALSKCTFEESLDIITKAATSSEEDNMKGVSASLICGKRPTVGTGMFDVKVDTDMILGTF